VGIRTSRDLGYWRRLGLLPASAQTGNAKIPNFRKMRPWAAFRPAPNSYRWQREPHRSTPDPAHSLYSKRPRPAADFAGCDLDNPILQPWVKEALKTVHDRVLSGKAASRRKALLAARVPGFVLFPRSRCSSFQRPAEGC